MIISEPEKINLGSHFISLLGEMWQYYLYQLDECQQHFSEEAVHDLRVCIRRFQSLNHLINSIFQNNYFNEIKAGLREQIKSLSQLRDIQVQILEIQNLRLKYPELNQFYYHLISNEDRLIKKINKKIHLLSADELEGFVYFLKLHIRKNSLENELIYDEIKSVVQNNYNFVLEHKNNLERLYPETIHKLRLAFKVYRYILEHLQGFFNLSDEFISDLRKYQTYMGEIQDNQVLYLNIEKFAREQSHIPYRAFEYILRIVVKEGEKLIDEFMNNADMVHKFSVS